MSYLVLARKYRPRSFEALVGQEHVVQALANALTQGRLHHAYLFTGTRGVGKTTVSRILAKSLNCSGADGQGGVTAHPCGVCDACRDIDAGRFVDYIELDAASNRGVEEIGALLDQAVYKPVLGRFKVYMIDEVHMLSNHAFNAMLKTLEEPPDYLKFVLATTDPQKVPPTVLSRCLQFNLRPMAPDTVQAYLAEVLAAESIAAEPGALRLLARAARGSMRDALSLTDQAIAYGAGALAETGVRQMLGAVDRGHAVRIVEALADADGAALVTAADGLRALGLSASGTLEEMAELFQQMALAQAVPGALDATDPDHEAACRLAPRLAADETQLLYSLALHGRGELALAPDEHSGLVMVLLRMLAFRPADARPSPGHAGSPAPVAATGAAPVVSPAAPVAAAPAAAVAMRPAVAPARVLPPSAPARVELPADDMPPWVDAAPDDTAPTARSDSPALVAIAPAFLATPTVSAVLSAAPRPLDAPRALLPLPPASAAGDRWAAVVAAMVADGIVNALPRELAVQAECIAIDETSVPPVWRLRAEREVLRSPAQRERLQAALAQHLGHPVTLELEAGLAADSPALRDAALRERRQREAEQIIHDDPLVQSLLAQFKTARIVPGSVKPH